MNIEKIISELSQRYPAKKIVKNTEQNPSEIICEIDQAADHPEKDIAIAVIDKSESHYHKKSTEIYKVLKGKLTLIVDNQEYKLKEGDSITIKPGQIHSAIGNETWVECHSEPGWTSEDHILID